MDLVDGWFLDQHPAGSGVVHLQPAVFRARDRSYRSQTVESTDARDDGTSESIARLPIEVISPIGWLIRRKIVDSIHLLGDPSGKERMKITDVEAIILRLPAVDENKGDGSQDDVVLQVHTDEGIIGVAEVDSSPEVVKAAIEAPSSHVIARGLRELLIGEDPLQVEQLWDKLYRHSIYYARRGIGMHAISGLDIALWDIKGKALGKPVCKLLGLPTRDRVRAYGSVLMPETPDAVVECVRGLVDAGFTAVKLGWGPLGRDVIRDIELVRAARAAAGKGVDIIIDAGLGYSADVGSAMRLARELERQ